VGVLLGQIRRSVSAVVPAAPEVVREFYVDLDNLARVHPLVVAVESVDSPRGAREYRVTDRVRLGPVRLRIHYAVTMTARDGALGGPAVPARAPAHVGVVRGGGVETVLTEDMRIEAPRPLLGLTVRRAVAAHREMLAGVAAHFRSDR
jgi:hypothetical protein